MLKQLSVGVLLIFLAGCGTHKVQFYGEVDRSDKTVMVPPGSEGLKGRLKQALAEDGWKLVIYRGPSVTEGEAGEKTKLLHYDTYNSRYQLVVSSYQYGSSCPGFGAAMNYDVSFIDNTSGNEVFTINGRGCGGGTAVKNFMRMVRGR